MERGDKEEDIYTESGREELLEEEDEINEVEEGFMEGYASGERTFACAHCHKILAENPIEEEFSGKLCRFCSSVCVTKYEERHRRVTQ